MAIKTIKKHIELMEEEYDKLEQELEKIREMAWELQASEEYEKQVMEKGEFQAKIKGLLKKESYYCEKAKYHSREDLENSASCEIMQYKHLGDISYLWIGIENLYWRTFHRDDDINIVADIFVRIGTFLFATLCLSTVIIPVIGLLGLAHHKIKESKFKKKEQKIYKERKELEAKHEATKFPLIEKMDQLKKREGELIDLKMQCWDYRKYKTLSNINDMAQKIATKKKLVIKNKETKQTTENTYINQEENVM